MRSCIPQKQPPARIAVSADVVTVVLLLLGRAPEQRAPLRALSVVVLGSTVSRRLDQRVLPCVRYPNVNEYACAPGSRNMILEGALADWSGLADELVQPRFGKRAVALVVHVGPVGSARGLPVEEHPEVGRRPPRCRSHDQVQVAGLEPVDNLPLGLVEHDALWLDRPVTGKGPMVEPQPCRGGVVVRLARQDAAGGGEILRARVAGVVLR